jgi:anti-sigma regulatory factor (Ser/Thr protein kinase)
MSAAEFRRSVTIPAAPQRVRAVRDFVAKALGESRGNPNLALLLASELVTNSVRHSGSAVPGGVVTVTAAAGDEFVRVEVTDRCGDGVPVLPSTAPADDEAEGSRDWSRNCGAGRWLPGLMRSGCVPGSRSCRRNWRGRRGRSRGLVITREEVGRLLEEPAGAELLAGPGKRARGRATAKHRP